MAWSKLETQPPFEGIQATSAALTGAGGHETLNLNCLNSLTHAMVLDKQMLQQLLRGESGPSGLQSASIDSHPPSTDSSFLLVV